MDVKAIVNRLCTKYKTRSPYELADALNIRIYRHELGEIKGYSVNLLGGKNVVLNSSLSHQYEEYVLAHEIGHILLHEGFNGAFIKYCTGLVVNKFEREADAFAATLLITDDCLNEYDNLTIEQFASLTGYPKSLIELRLE